MATSRYSAGFLGQTRIETVDRSGLRITETSGYGPHSSCMVNATTGEILPMQAVTRKSRYGGEYQVPVHICCEGHLYWVPRGFQYAQVKQGERGVTAPVQVDEGHYRMWMAFGSTTVYSWQLKCGDEVVETYHGTLGEAYEAAKQHISDRWDVNGLIWQDVTEQDADCAAEEVLAIWHGFAHPMALDGDAAMYAIHAYVETVMRPLERSFAVPYLIAAGLSYREEETGIENDAFRFSSIEEWVKAVEQQHGWELDCVRILNPDMSLGMTRYERDATCIEEEDTEAVNEPSNIVWPEKAWVSFYDGKDYIDFQVQTMEGTGYTRQAQAVDVFVLGDSILISRPSAERNPLSKPVHVGYYIHEGRIVEVTAYPFKGLRNVLAQLFDGYGAVKGLEAHGVEHEVQTLAGSKNYLTLGDQSYILTGGGKLIATTLSYDVAIQDSLKRVYTETTFEQACWVKQPKLKSSYGETVEYLDGGILIVKTSYGYARYECDKYHHGALVPCTGLGADESYDFHSYGLSGCLSAQVQQYLDTLDFSEVTALVHEAVVVEDEQLAARFSHAYEELMAIKGRLGYYKGSSHRIEYSSIEEYAKKVLPFVLKSKEEEYAGISYLMELTSGELLCWLENFRLVSEIAVDVWKAYPTKYSYQAYKFEAISRNLPHWAVVIAVSRGISFEDFLSMESKKLTEDKSEYFRTALEDALMASLR